MFFCCSGSKSSPKDSSKHVLIMDEVDGMAGNEDRGGMQVQLNMSEYNPTLLKYTHVSMINGRPKSGHG